MQNLVIKVKIKRNFATSEGQWRRLGRPTETIMDNWDYSQQMAICSVLLGLGTLSAIGSALMIATIIVLGKYRKSYWRQVIGLSIMELTTALSMVFSCSWQNAAVASFWLICIFNVNRNLYLFFPYPDCRGDCILDRVAV